MEHVGTVDIDHVHGPGHLHTDIDPVPDHGYGWCDDDHVHFVVDDSVHIIGGVNFFTFPWSCSCMFSSFPCPSYCL